MYGNISSLRQESFLQLKSLLIGDQYWLFSTYKWFIPKCPHFYTQIAYYNEMSIQSIPIQCENHYNTIGPWTPNVYNTQYCLYKYANIRRYHLQCGHISWTPFIALYWYSTVLIIYDLRNEGLLNEKSQYLVDISISIGTFQTSGVPYLYY